MPCPFIGPKIVCAGPIVLCRTKIYLHIVPVPNFLCQTKRWFIFSKFHFSAGTKLFGVALNAIQFLILHKIFGPAQNILGLVEGQGLSIWLFIGDFQLKLAAYFYLKYMVYKLKLYKIIFQQMLACIADTVLAIKEIPLILKYVKVTRSVIYTVLGQEPCVDSLANPQ